MAQYIYVKRKTVRRIAALTVFLVVAIAATILFPRACALFRGAGEPRVETMSRNVITIDGRERLFFRSVGDDGTLVGLTLHKDSVTYATPIHGIKHTSICGIIRKTITQAERRIKALKAARAEMRYYKRVHNVQDEGYSMVAAHDNELQQTLNEEQALLGALNDAARANAESVKMVHTATSVDCRVYQYSPVAVVCGGGRWKRGLWMRAKIDGPSITTDLKGRTVCALFRSDTVVSGRRTDSLGTYIGEMNRDVMAAGHGRFVGTDNSFYEGHWQENRRHGFGFAISSDRLRAGEWEADVYKGERIQYTSERIYGIDISKYQHGKGRKYLPIHWDKLRIVHLGKVGNRNASGAVDYTVSFVYIKSTEGTSVRNKYFVADYRQSRRHGYRTGVYHFFSTKSSPTAQANFFVSHSGFHSGDMPPVLDVEPTDRQIAQIGGAAELFRRIRTWMGVVERRTNRRPVLYVNQRFVNKYLSLAPDIKRDYKVWIARYGEYKPDVKLVYWQLCADGRVSGITGDVDINVFNGYRDTFSEFVGK